MTWTVVFPSGIQWLKKVLKKLLQPFMDKTFSTLFCSDFIQNRVSTVKHLIRTLARKIWNSWKLIIAMRNGICCENNTNKFENYQISFLGELLSWVVCEELFSSALWEDNLLICNSCPKPVLQLVNIASWRDQNLWQMQKLLCNPFSIWTSRVKLKHSQAICCLRF